MIIMTKMEDNNVVEGLERTFADMHPYQYVREIYQNSVEAGATDIRFTIDKVALKIFEVKRGVGIDNGPGIPKDKIKDLINKKNSSSKGIGGADQNFGVGLKVAALPRNQYGLIVMCRTKERPKGFMIWLCYGEDHNGNTVAGTKGLTSREQWEDYHNGIIGEPVPNDLIDFQEIEDLNYESFEYHGIDWMSWWDSNSKNETGTAVILCGNKIDENTFDRLVKDGRRFLASRYLNYPIAPFFRRPDRGTYYRLKDPINMLKKYSIDHGKFIFRDWRLLYFVSKENTNAQQHEEEASVLTQKTFKEAILYKDEAYGDYTDLHPLTVASLRNAWGIYYKSVGDRVTIIVEPPVYTKKKTKGVYPNEARSKLSWKDSKDSAPVQTIPLEDLRKYFRNNMPESIKKLIEEQANQEVTQSRESKLAKELNKWMTIPRDKRKSKQGQGLLISNPNGHLFGGNLTGELFNQLNEKGDNPQPPYIDPNPKPKPKPKPTKEELERKEKKRQARELAEKKRQEPPEVIFHKQSDSQAEEWFKRNGQWQVAFYEPPGVNGQGNKLRINKNHVCFVHYRNVVEDWLESKAYKMHKTQIMDKIIIPFWQDFGPTAIQQAKAIPSVKRDTNGFDPERLSFAFYGAGLFCLKFRISFYFKNFLKEHPDQC